MRAQGGCGPVQSALLIWKARFTGELDTAACREFPAHDGLLRSACADQVIENLIHDHFIEGGMVAVGGEVELERLGFHTEAGRDIQDLDVSRVGLTRDGAERAEIRCAEVDRVKAALCSVRESLQHGLGR